MVELTIRELRATLDAFEIERDSILLTHSSLKALGRIEGGCRNGHPRDRGDRPRRDRCLPYPLAKEF